MQKLIALFSILSLALVLAWLGPQQAGADVPVEGNEVHAKLNAVSVTSGVSVISAVTGRIISVKALRLSSDTAAVVEFRDGAADGTVLGAIYVKADIPLQVPSDVLGKGINTTAGTALWIKQASGTVTADIRYRLER